MDAHAPLPPVLAGPLLRRVEPQRLVLWLAASRPLGLRLRLFGQDQEQPFLERPIGDAELQSLQFGTQAWLYLMDLALEAPLPLNSRIGYDLGIAGDLAEAPAWIQDWAPALCRPGAARPDFVLKPRLDRLLHGSCRRPHDAATDGLLRVDEDLVQAGDDAMARPALLMLSGDQVYVDDVAGPMLRAIHALISRLGLYDERLSGAEVKDGRALQADERTYYHRELLLPAAPANRALLERFFGGTRKPVFTSANARNHLVTLAEVLAMYLLVWSPHCWRLISIEAPVLAAEDAERWKREEERLAGFVASLPRAARALAHLPTYMIFDDHDITDDWNLSAQWEATVYEHPFSRRIIGNALIGYLLGQGWGNVPEDFAGLLPRLHRLMEGARAEGCLDAGEQDALIDELLHFRRWHYQLPTQPPLVVLDTRTRRWRSERSLAAPSGLMDWEALSELQQDILGQQQIVVVSPTPIFGVKLIEAIQRVFTLVGRPLMVDAENWMAHPGTANVLLNIFGHSRTPDHFVILSGDVHYSFVYGVRLRQHEDHPRIWQITSSGIKSQFPRRLLDWLDRLNRWLYAPWSPLNLLTKRRHLKVSPWLPEDRSAGERLWNHAGIGLVLLDATGRPVEIRQLHSEGGGTRFLPDPDLPP